MYEDWGDSVALGKLMKVVHDAGMSSLNMYTCDECGFCTLATNKLCPFCKRHLKELYNPSVPGGTQKASGSRIIQRLAKSLITDNNCPGFAFPYRGMRSLMWRQMMTLVKYHKSWQEERTWVYNSRDPGQPFTSLMDRIMHDDVFCLNLILNGGWTKDTMHILVELVDLALDQKAWNQKYGHLSYADGKDYYVRRAARFKNRKGGSDEQYAQACDEPALNKEEKALKQVEALGKGRGIQAASAAKTRKPPNPAILFSEFWNRGDTARWGCPSMPEFLQDQAKEELPYQRGAPGGAAGNAPDARLYLGPAGPGGPANPFPAEQIFSCLQCNEPSAIINLWNCDRCSKMLRCLQQLQRVSVFGKAAAL